MYPTGLREFKGRQDAVALMKRGVHYCAGNGNWCWDDLRSAAADFGDFLRRNVFCIEGRPAASLPCWMLLKTAAGEVPNKKPD
jgi:hypothetical protein